MFPNIKFKNQIIVKIWIKRLKSPVSQRINSLSISSIILMNSNLKPIIEKGTTGGLESADVWGDQDDVSIAASWD